MHEKCTQVTYKFLNSGQAPVVALIQDNALLLSFPESCEGSCLNIYHLMFQKKRAHCSTMMLFETSVLFPGPIEHMWVWVGSSHRPTVGLFAHICAKYLLLCAFVYFPNSSQIISTHPKIQNVGKRPLCNCIKEK